MKNRLKLSAVVPAVLLLALLTSCADKVDPSSPGGSRTSTSSSPNPATTMPPSETDVASKAASQLVRTYYAVRDELRQDPKVSLDKLSSIATSTELSAQEKLFKRERKDGLHQVGSTRIATLTVQSVNLDNSDQKVGKVPTVKVDVCYDVSAVDVIDPKGKSIVSPDRTDTGWIRYFVANYKWATDPTRAWRVASSENIERTSCAGS